MVLNFEKQRERVIRLKRKEIPFGVRLTNSQIIERLKKGKRK